MLTINEEVLRLIMNHVRIHHITRNENKLGNCRSQESTQEIQVFGDWEINARDNKSNMT